LTELEFHRLITTNRADLVLNVLAGMPEKDRRQFAKSARDCLKAYEDAHWDRQVSGKPIAKAPAKDGDALRIAVLATGVPSEIAKDAWRVMTQSISITDVFDALKPSWIGRWAEAAVEANPHLIETIQDLNQQGLCPIPDTDAYIMGYYTHRQAVSDLAGNPHLLKDVWRFFEVEGGGEFSLSAHEKYASKENTWAVMLLRLSAEGTLDRDRLLDASLDALERDFGQFRAGWYSRFHVALAPTPDEAAARSARYLRLLGSMVPPTVSFALKALKNIDRAHGLAPEPLLATIEPALQSRQKSSVLAALQLLKSCAKRNPDRAKDIAKVAVSALISESGEAQERVLDLIEQVGQMQNPDVRALLGLYLDTTAPTVQARLSGVLGKQAQAPDAAPAYPVPTLEAVHPVGSVEEAVAVFLELLEDCHDPFLMERAIDGLARFGAAAQPLLSPLAKRAKQLQKREVEGGYSPGKYFQKSISATALAWAKGTQLAAELEPFYAERYPGHRPFRIAPDSFEGMFAARSAEMLGLVQTGLSARMLSAPTDNRGYLDPAQLIARLQDYRAIGMQPGSSDFKLALMRLAPEGREEALSELQPETEAERALAYALGADSAPEADLQLWVIAWSSRLPLVADPRIQELVGGEIPGAGTPVAFEFGAGIRRSREYSWIKPFVTVTPPPPQDVDHAISFGLPWKCEHIYLGGTYPSWMSHANAWVSIVRPAHSELFFLTGLFELDLDQKLASHPCLTFLEPFFRPELRPGPMSHAMLAWYLAAADGAIGATTVDAMATLIAQDRFETGLFADAARKLIFEGGLPLRRWTMRISEITGNSLHHASAVKATLSAIMTEMPQDLPRDLGGILELLHELHTASGTVVENTALLRSLERVEVGGKIGKFAKKLMALSPQ